jgi:hypothetical protein
MSQPEIEMADVQIILQADWQDRMAQAVELLKGAGVQIEDVNEEEGEVEGVVPSDKIAALRKLEPVAYVRTVFRYEDEESESDDDEDGFEQL